MIDDKNPDKNGNADNFRPLIPSYPVYVERAQWDAAQAASEAAFSVEDEARNYERMFYNYGLRFAPPVEPIVPNTQSIEKALLELEVFRADILAKMDVISAELEILLERSKDDDKDA